MATSDVAQSVDVRITPGTGLPATRFIVSFTAPGTSGHIGRIERKYDVSASVSRAADGCASSVSVHVPRAAAHARVSVTLDPRGEWCLGAFAGRVVESHRPWCPKRARGCSTIAWSLLTVGRFTFRVAEAPTGPTGPTAPTDTRPPTFGGLESAYACTPGPQRPSETTPFTLTWSAASDDVSPASQIVYDVFISTTPGDENFATPTWTTAPGATSFRTPGLSSHGTFYFVVRSRDQAGNEDQNTVERRGVDPCY
jgi:hypothetical protein